MRATASGGVSQRDHLLQVYKQTGKTPEELGIELPDTEILIPEGGEFLWRTFWDLSLSRGNNGFTENPLPWREMQAYADLTGIDWTPFEAATLHDMDRAYLTSRAELTAKDSKKR